MSDLTPNAVAIWGYWMWWAPGVEGGRRFAFPPYARRALAIFATSLMWIGGGKGAGVLAERLLCSLYS